MTTIEPIADCADLVIVPPFSLDRLRGNGSRRDDVGTIASPEL
jgi:hypothetical protein